MVRLQLFSLCVCCVVFLASCRTSPLRSEDQVSLFTFGDSMFDVGNNIYLNTSVADIYPYGETFFKRPTGRHSDGRLIPDFITQFAGLPFIPPYLQPNVTFAGGISFASGGAGTLPDTFKGYVLDLKMQLELFIELENKLKNEFGDEKANKIISEAVYLISIGSNDYLYPYLANSTFFQTVSKENHVDMVIGNLTEVIKGIHGRGARKIGFLGVGPLGCLPFLRGASSKGGCLAEANTISKLHNRALTRVVQELERDLDGFKYSMLNFYDIISERINHTSEYGFKEGKMGCCGSGPYRGGVSSCGVGVEGKDYELCENPSKYIYFDGAHPTEKANRQFAKLWWRGSALNTTGPYNLKALFKA